LVLSIIAMAAIPFVATSLLSRVPFAMYFMSSSYALVFAAADCMAQAKHQQPTGPLKPPNARGETPMRSRVSGSRYAQERTH
jgi:hypothetical protein